MGKLNVYWIYREEKGGIFCIYSPVFPICIFYIIKASRFTLASTDRHNSFFLLPSYLFHDIASKSQYYSIIGYGWLLLFTHCFPKNNILSQTIFKPLKKITPGIVQSGRRLVHPTPNATDQVSLWTTEWKLIKWAAPFPGTRCPNQP